jgi:uncharacterized protein (DUF4415 family)
MKTEEIRNRNPLTPDVLTYFKQLAVQEPNMTDEDNPDVVEMLKKGCYKKETIDNRQSVVVRLEPIVLHALRQKGKDWQIQLNDHLKSWLLQNQAQSVTNL